MIRSVSSYINTLYPEFFSPRRLEEYQLDVSALLVLKFKPCFLACSSCSPTDANGGMVNTTLGVSFKQIISNNFSFI
jgi:hypothetical protein